MRITPAGAGKTTYYKVNYRRDKDHPRRCGENGNTPSSLCCFTGSPPQVRGKRVRSVAGIVRTWITPAGAGKTETNIQKTDAE